MKTVIFDFDGTIADTFPFTYEIVKELAPKYGYQATTKAEIEDLREMPFRDIIKKYQIGPFKLFCMTLDAHAANARRIDKTSVFPGVSDMLRQLKNDGYGLAIMSSNSKPNIERFLKLNDLDIFDDIETSLSLFGKDKKIKKIMRRLGISSADVLYVGDEVRDIEAAREAGIKIISVTWGYNTEVALRKLNTVIAHDVDELASIIEKTFK